MKILWITSSNFMPEIAKELGFSCLGTGGWMAAMLQQLRRSSEATLAVAYVSKKIKQPICRIINGVEYWLFPTKKNSWEYDDSLEKYWKQLQAQFQPEIVHIHGTEYSYGLAYIRACGSKNVVVSMQGLVSEIGKVYYAGISDKEIRCTETMSDKILRKGIRHIRQYYLSRGEHEKEYLRTLKYVIGHTEWDKSVVLGVNPQLRYYTNNESLNNVFYEHTWKYVQCEPHTIFVPQCTSPIKGFHILLKAMPIVLENYPDAHIYVAGGNTVYSHTIKKKITDSGYNVYLRELITQFGLKDHITFLGTIPPEEMCGYYLRSNVFVMSSAIENGCNAIGEAQLLGMPTISSDIPGVQPSTRNGALSLQYTYDNFEQLAEHLITIFSGEYDKNMFVNAQKVARERHSREQNSNVLMGIYKDIVSRDN